jgi:hypothetical protein
MSANEKKGVRFLFEWIFDAGCLIIYIQKIDMRNRWQIIGNAAIVMAGWAFVQSATGQTASPYTMPSVTASQASGANPNGANRIQAPVARDNQIGEDEITIAPPPPMADTLEQFLKEKSKNWVEMTPEEILGIPPLKKPFATKSTDASRENFGQSPLENLVSTQRASQQRFLKENGSLTEQEDGSQLLSSPFNLPGTERPGSMPGANLLASPLNRLLESARESSFRDAEDPGWVSVFHTPAAAPATAAEQADMEACKALLNPPEPAHPESMRTLPVDPDVEPLSARFNPNGATFAPQDDGINRPRRLDALPTATTSSGLQSPYASPGAPKPPPWTVKTPQLFVEPQRKF